MPPQQKPTKQCIPIFQLYFIIIIRLNFLRSIFKYVGILFSCLSVYHMYIGLVEAREDAGSPRTEVIDSCVC